MTIVEVVVDGFFDDADGMGWLLVEIDAYLFENVVRDVVVGIAGDHICT